MKHHLHSAAPTALRRLWRPALAGLLSLSIACQGDEPAPPPEAPAPAPTEAAVEAVAEEVVDPDALPAIEATIVAWNIELEAFSIDAAAFDGELLVLVAATAEGPMLIRYKQVRGPGEATTTPQEKDRRLLQRDDATPPSLVRIGPSLVAMWVASGRLEAMVLDAKTPLGTSAVKVLAAEEGGAFNGVPLVAEREDEALVCVRDGATPLCIALDARLETRGLFPLDRRKDERPELIAATDDGFLLVVGRCRSESCSRKTLEVLALDETGRPTGKARSLPEIQVGRGTHTIETDEGLVLIARRVGAGEHSAWHVTRDGAMELDGRFSRAVGGFALDDRTMLVERAHLKMRQGFPVAGFNLRALTFERRKAVRPAKQKVARESFPEAIAKALPTAVDQTFVVNEDALLFATPRVKGMVRAAVLRLSDAPPPERPGGT